MIDIYERAVRLALRAYKLPVHRPGLPFHADLFGICGGGLDRPWPPEGVVAGAEQAVPLQAWGRVGL
jgi:hypothetical protein